jgi:hypothetical protein
VSDGFGQSADAELEFFVDWNHQALIPSAEAEADEANDGMLITPIPPNGTAQGDTFDIYRLSADQPELIVKDGEWGTTYVDPYPAFREMGGHRVVFKTANGDYITEDNELAWVDLGESNDDILDRDYTVIDFGTGTLKARLNMELSHSFEKSFSETRYKGGSIVGDWNKGIRRTGTVKSVYMTANESEIIALRALARYAGICHVRTPDGSSFHADVQVSEDRSYSSPSREVSFSLAITRVDSQGLDGMTLAEWEQRHPESE